MTQRGKDGHPTGRMNSWDRLRAFWSDSSASQIVEFAVALPLLVVFVVGIFDFGNAFGVKYRLTSAVREAARLATTEPSSDLSDPNTAVNGSVQAVASLVGNQLLAYKVNDCGLDLLANQTITQSGLVWTYQASSGCPGTLTLVIDRGYVFPAAASSVYAGGLVVEGTHITISYPYRWQFNNVMQLLGGTYAATSQISAEVTMQNLN